MLSKKLSLFLLFFMPVMGIQTVALAGDTDYTRDSEAEWQVLTELNHWCLHKGLEPLMRNPDLDVLAMEQAQYIVPQLPDKRFEADPH
jgi:hypothetical protein